MLVQKAKQQERQLRMHTTENLNGYHNLGQYQVLMEKLPHDLSVYDKVVLLAIARYSIGYCRATTNVPEGKGTNRNSKAWADQLCMSKSSFLRSIKFLESIKLIRIHKGSQYMSNGGSFPDYYSLVFDAEFQRKHHIYFNLKNDNTAALNLDTKQYFVNDYGTINLLKLNGKPTIEWKHHCDHSKEAKLVHPTMDQLLIYLGE